MNSNEIFQLCRRPVRRAKKKALPHLPFKGTAVSASVDSSKSMRRCPVGLLRGRLFLCRAVQLLVQKTGVFLVIDGDDRHAVDQRTAEGPCIRKPGAFDLNGGCVCKDIGGKGDQISGGQIGRDHIERRIDQTCRFRKRQGGGDLVKDRSQNVALTFGASEVGAEGTVARVTQSKFSVQMMNTLCGTCGQQSFFCVHGDLIGCQMHINAADRIDDGNQTRKVDDDIILDVKGKDVVDGVDAKTRTAKGKCRVDAVVAVSLDRDIGIAQKRDPSVRLGR